MLKDNNKEATKSGKIEWYLRNIFRKKKALKMKSTTFN